MTGLSVNTSPVGFGSRMTPITTSFAASTLSFPRRSLLHAAAHMNVGRVMDALKRQHPRPEPDPEWVIRCMDGLVAEGKADSYENVLEEYLDADLAECTLRGVIPQADEEDKLQNGVLFPTPTLAQVVSITDIGASAFSLQTTLEQRREVFSGATRIRGIDDGDEEIDESKLPAYPRSMLSIEVSDGRTTMRAIEYRRLEGLELGETRLGIKLRLHRVKVLGGRLLLEPGNCNVVGGWIEALELGQPQAFVEGLKTRLEAAKNPAPRGWQRRTLTSRGTTNARARSTRGTAAARGSAVTRGAARPPVSDAARAARAAAILAAAGNPEPSPPARPTPPIEPSSRPPPAAAPNAGSYDNPTVISDDEDEFDDLDDSFFAAVDQVEAAAAASSSSAPRRSQRSSGRTTIPEDAEIIEISD